LIIISSLIPLKSLNPLLKIFKCLNRDKQDEKDKKDNDGRRYPGLTSWSSFHPTHPGSDLLAFFQKRGYPFDKREVGEAGKLGS
jgi:hypothetical protein